MPSIASRYYEIVRRAEAATRGRAQTEVLKFRLTAGHWRRVGEKKIFVRKAKVKRKKVGKAKGWRATLGLNWVESKKYKSTTYSKEFKRRPSDRDIEKMRWEFIPLMEKEVGYPRDVWWFDNESTAFNLEVIQIGDYAGRIAFWTEGRVKR